MINIKALKDKCKVVMDSHKEIKRLVKDINKMSEDSLGNLKDEDIFAHFKGEIICKVPKKQT